MPRRIPLSELIPSMPYQYRTARSRLTFELSRQTGLRRTPSSARLSTNGAQEAKGQYIPLHSCVPSVASVTLSGCRAVATLGDVLLTRCSGSGLRVNLLPTHLVRELAAELGGNGATQSALPVGRVQHLGGGHDGRMSLGVFRVLHAQLNVGIDGQEVVAQLTAEAFSARCASRPS